MPVAAVPRLTPYQRRLFALLTIATFFEGFDVSLAGLLLPLLGDEFGADEAALGRVLGIAGIGMILAFVALRAADRAGRRPVFLAALAGFSVLTLATAFSTNLVTFTALQLAARFFLVTQVALAYVILSEELPPALRGRANGWLGAFGSAGAALPYALLDPLQEAGVGWRGLFAIGALPLLVWPLCAAVLRETRVFAERKGAHEPPSFRAEVRTWLRLLGPALRRRFAGIAALWITVNFWAGTAMSFFTLYVFQERGWTAADLRWLPFGMIPAGVFGYAAAGYAMDAFGRRSTATGFLAAGALGTWVCFNASDDAVVLGAYLVLVGLNGLWPIASTVTAELFPTELRATAGALANNVVGRIGIVAGPPLAGALAVSLGSLSRAISLLVIVNLCCIPILWATLPETREAELGDGATAQGP